MSVFKNAGWFGIAGSQDYHTTLHCILDTWNCCFFVLSGTHITPNSLSFLCIVCFASSLLGLLMEKICHSCCVVRGWRTLPLSYIRYLNNESLNCLYDNSEQEVIKTKLFKMVRPEWGITASSSISMSICCLGTLHHIVKFHHIPLVSLSLVL
jgi:hypothetical protein